MHHLSVITHKQGDLCGNKGHTFAKNATFEMDLKADHHLPRQCS